MFLGSTNFLPKQFSIVLLNIKTKYSLSCSFKYNFSNDFFECCCHDKIPKVTMWRAVTFEGCEEETVLLSLPLPPLTVAPPYVKVHRGSFIKTNPHSSPLSFHGCRTVILWVNSCIEVDGQPRYTSFGRGWRPIHHTGCSFLGFFFRINGHFAFM